MPLVLGGIETERPQLITYDPTVAAEVQEALERRTRLERAGFRVHSEVDGEVLLEPPPRHPNFGCFRIISDNVLRALHRRRLVPWLGVSALRRVRSDDGRGAHDPAMAPRDGV